jgi:hypothetical protein
LSAVVAETTTFELVEAQGPLTESLMQEPFVLVSLGLLAHAYFCVVARLSVAVLGICAAVVRHRLQDAVFAQCL